MVASNDTKGDAATDSSTASSISSGIPIVDFSTFTTESTFQERQAVANELASACRRVGFVYIINHGLSPEMLKEAFGWTKELYSLSHEEKMQAPHPEGYAIHRGYSHPGLEKVSNAASKVDGDEEAAKKLREVTDCKESYEIGSETNPDQPNVWLPESTLPGYRDFMNSFYWSLFSVSKTILRALALGIGLDESHLLKFHSGLNNQLRLLHYPSIPAAAVESGRMVRMPAHSDWSSMTMLFQDDCGGLEVEDPKKPGTFIAAMPMEGAIVMNVGDLLQHWSNDYLKSTLHRVTLPPLADRFEGEERMTRERYSIVYFNSTDPDLVIECLRPDENEPPKYEPITQREYSAVRARLQYPKKLERNEG